MDPCKYPRFFRDMVNIYKTKYTTTRMVYLFLLYKSSFHLKATPLTSQARTKPFLLKGQTKMTSYDVLISNKKHWKLGSPRPTLKIRCFPTEKDAFCSSVQICVQNPTICNIFIKDLFYKIWIIILLFKAFSMAVVHWSDLDVNIS